MHNFYLPPDKWIPDNTNTPGIGQMPCVPETTQILDGPEARHLAKVLRIRPGEEVRLLDGEGRSGRFRVLSLEKSSVQLAPLQVERLPRPGNRCWLAAAYTKAARRSWLLEKSVELEAGGIWFWQAEHSQAKTPEAGKENWQDQLVAGAKQCFNPWLPELRTFPGGAKQLADYVSGPNFSHRILLWEDASEDMLLTEADFAPVPNPQSKHRPDGQNNGQPEQPAHSKPDQPGDSQPEQSDNVTLGQTDNGGSAAGGDTLFVMGPEGGLSAAEVELFHERGFKCVSLGRRILRWETAALLCLSLGFWARQRLRKR